MAKTRHVLGRGLSALIPDLDEDPKGRVIDIEIEKIDPNPFQPRKNFSPEEIQELAASIKENGLLQPIHVRKREERYQIIYGERRLRSFMQLKRRRIPAIVHESISDVEMLSRSLVENIQRRNLNEIEEARAYEALLTKCGYSHEQLAEQVGKSRPAITNALRLLKLPDLVQQELVDKRISMGHARALLALKSPHEMEQLCRDIIKNNYSVREIEMLAKQDIVEPQAIKQKLAKSHPQVDPNIEQLQEQLQHALGTRVTVTSRNGKGKIEIAFYSLDDLNRIHSLLIQR